MGSRAIKIHRKRGGPYGHKRNELSEGMASEDQKYKDKSDHECCFAQKATDGDLRPLRHFFLGQRSQFQLTGREWMAGSGQSRHPLCNSSGGEQHGR
jgi:hypothetical protein